MRVIGILGGMSEQATAIYYSRLNQQAKNKLGGLHQARCVIWSFDFDDLAQLMAEGNWEQIGALLADAGQRLVKAGAECIIIAANTMHKVADVVAKSVPVPLLHVADATAASIRQAGLSRPGLLATRYTMEQDFYVGHLRERFGLGVVIPDYKERNEIHRIIFSELCKGEVKPESKRIYLDVIDRLQKRDADCIILGCTEIGMLIKQHDVSLPLFDTALIHADAALEWAFMNKAA